MRFTKFQKYFSYQRLQRYLSATSGNKIRARKLYAANIKVSQVFHPLLGIFEVALRNRINEILTNYFSDPDWIQTQKTGFMIDPSLTYTYKRTGQTKTNSFLKNEVEKAERRLQKSGIAISSGKIISEQSLGFWTDFFAVHHYRLLKGRPIQIFSSLPSGFGRKEVNEELGKIRLFRNRIHHNEPICFHGTSLDFNTTHSVHQSIKNILSWIDNDLLNYLNDFDRVQKTISFATKI